MVHPQQPFSGRVIFDHLRKTAGIATREWLAGALGTSCVAPHSDGEHRGLIRRFGGEYSVISGHITFRGGGLDPRYDYLTCFREPIDRAISWLFFMVNNHDVAQIGRRQADRFVQTEGDDLDQDLMVNLRNPYVEHFAAIVDSSFPRSDDEKLSTAVSMIRQYKVWGFFEEHLAFLSDVAALIGLPAPTQVERINVTRSRPLAEAISSPLRRRLEELNALDLQLYDILRGDWEAARLRGIRARAPNVSLWSPYNDDRDRAFSGSGFTLINATLDATGTVSRGEHLVLTADFSLESEIAELEIGVHIFDEDGRWAFGTNTTLLKRFQVQIGRGSHRVQYWLVADLPEGNYTAGLAFAARHADGLRELGWYDKLVEFVVEIPRPQTSIGYASIPAVVTCRQTSQEVIGLVEDASGLLSVNCELDGVHCGESVMINVRIENTSSERWVNTLSNPITLSYHWFDETGQSVIFDGERSPFPVAELAPKKAVSARMTVISPQKVGRYRLVLLPVQEGHCWFEDRGFIPGSLDLNVIEGPTPQKADPLSEEGAPHSINLSAT